MSILYDLEEVAKHNHEKDLWIIINNGIYDLTKFLKEHPGGEEVLLNLAGGDGTECFDAIGHSTEAVQLREMYRVGNIANNGSEKAEKVSTEKVPTSTQPNVNDEEPWDYVEHKDESTSWIFFLGLAVIIYAIIFYYIL